MLKNIEKYIKKRSKVISLQYGVGEIIGIFNMYDGVDDYLEIAYFSYAKSKYLCINHLNDVRLVSSQNMIINALSMMNKRLCDDSIKNDFNDSTTQFLDKNVEFIVKRIVKLFRKNKLSDKETTLLGSTIDSLILEVREVYHVDFECARGIVSDYLKCA